MASKPSIPQGTRDFSAEVVRKRNYIFSVIRNVFELYSFQPLETPAMENLDTLMGKYGDEGDKLIYRILDSGNPFSKDFFQELGNYLKANYDNIENLRINNEEFKDIINPFGNALFELNPVALESVSQDLLKNRKYLAGFKNKVSDKALKYDLTIPFARYVAMNHTKLTFPFRRYQIQPVWRADRPQRGRYREFYQCDADVVGSVSLNNEIEIILLIDKVYTTLSDYFREDNNSITISINNRKIWAGIAELCGCSDKILDITVALDKFDKIGIDGVKEELIQKGFNTEQTHTIFSCLFPDKSYYTPYDDDYLNELNLRKDEKNLVVTLYGNNIEMYAVVTCLLWNFKTHNIEIGISGVKEILKIIFPFFMDSNNFHLKSCFIELDSTLARGLNYYTGTILEVKAPTSVKMGSIGGGGRYDDLTGLFGVPNIPGVGISFGVDRIYDVLEELNLFPQDVQVGTKALFFNMGEAESIFAFGIMQQLRSNGIACELYHEAAKINKQFTYAEKKNIPFVIIIGSKEIEDQNCSVKNLATGKQEVVSLDKLAEFFSNL